MSPGPIESFEARSLAVVVEALEFTTKLGTEAGGFVGDL